MAFAFRQWRLIAAAVFAVALVSGAYLLAGGRVPRAPEAQAAAETALLQQIASKDSDGDGLPDWEEALYGTDPNKAISNPYGVPDGEAVKEGLLTPQTPSVASTTPVKNLSLEIPVQAPEVGSLTDEFAKNFFTRYLTAQQLSNNNLTSAQITALANQAADTLLANATTSPDFRTANQLHVSGAGAAALAAYAADMEVASQTRGPASSKSEVLYLQDAIGGDSSAVGHIQAIANAYSSVAAAMAAVTVPKEATAAHLEVVNATARIGSITNDFAKLNSDPLATLFALQQYPQAVNSLGKSLGDLAAVLANVSPPVGTHGASFVTGLRDFVPAQQP